jgi:hypothetical protein
LIHQSSGELLHLYLTDGMWGGEHITALDAWFYNAYDGVITLGVTDANVRINFVTDENADYFDGVNVYKTLGQYSDTVVFTDPAAAGEYIPMRSVFTAEAAVSDFRYLALIYDDETMQPKTVETLYACDTLLPEVPVVIEWMHVGCFTSARGISFTDVNGVTRYFELIESNMDGRLVLFEFELG